MILTINSYPNFYGNTKEELEIFVDLYLQKMKDNYMYSIVSTHIIKSIRNSLDSFLNHIKQQTPLLRDYDIISLEYVEKRDEFNRKYISLDTKVKLIVNKSV